MNLLGADEVLQFAIRIEENGERFYREMARISSEDKLKKIFEILADEEVSHRETFEKMLAGVESYQPPESYPGEYFAYLRAYAEGVIFSPEVQEEARNALNDINSALNFAIRRELDSVLYYQEIKRLVPERERETIENIIEEERKHFLRLKEVKKSLSGM